MKNLENIFKTLNFVEQKNIRPIVLLHTAKTLVSHTLQNHKFTTTIVFFVIQIEHSLMCCFNP